MLNELFLILVHALRDVPAMFIRLEIPVNRYVSTPWH